MNQGIRIRMTRWTLMVPGRLMTFTLALMAQFSRLTEEDGQGTWVNELMILGIVVLIAAAVFAFWKAGGLTWVNTQLNSITNY